MSADGKSFTFKGVDFGGGSYNVYVKTASLPRLPRPRVAIHNYAQADGVATQGATFDEVSITLECAITASTTANVETAVANTIAQLAATQEGPGALVLDSHPTKQWTARLVSGLTGDLALNGERFTLEFLCTSPWPVATSSTNVTGNIAGGGVTTI